MLEDRPCWLYFDLEFSKVTNPSVDAAAVMEAFRHCFCAFCREILGAECDESELVQLESSTPMKFSRHVIVKKLVGDCRSHLLFENNAQAGIVAREFVSYLQLAREDPASLAGRLFLQPPPSDSDGGAAARRDNRVFIDLSVYSRNTPRHIFRKNE